MEMTLPSVQRLKQIQHVVPEDLNNGAQLGDEVTSLCGQTYRMRYKDDPNFLTCGMCALLLVREYRGLLVDHTRLLGILDEIIEASEKKAEVVPGDPEQGGADEPGTPDAVGVETEPSVGDGEERKEPDGGSSDSP